MAGGNGEDLGPKAGIGNLGFMLMICKEERAARLRDVLTSLLYRQGNQAPEKSDDGAGGWNPGRLILSPVAFPPTPTLPPYSSKYKRRKKGQGEGLFKP